MGHNLCLDIFGGPILREKRQPELHRTAEGSVVHFDIDGGGSQLTMKPTCRSRRFRFERTIELRGTAVRIHESAESFAAFDRPIVDTTRHAWPAVPRTRVTQSEPQRPSQRSSKASSAPMLLNAAAEFEWPLAPGKDGNVEKISAS